LCSFSPRNPMAEQGGWTRASSADPASDASQPATLVSGREADRFLGQSGKRATTENLSNFAWRREPHRGDARPVQRRGAELVPRWELFSFCAVVLGGWKVGYSHT